MKRLLLLALIICISSLVTALPSAARRSDDVVDLEDDPYAAELEQGMDLLAEESEVHETVASTEEPYRHYSPSRPRGSVRFANSATRSPERGNLPSRFRQRKVTTERPPPITTEEPFEYEDEPEEEPREENPRSLMVVLPYGTRNLTESKIQELYTKAPFTMLINTTTEQPTTTPKHDRFSTTVVVTPTSVARRPSTTTTTTKAPPVIRNDVKELLASIGLFPESIVQPKLTTRTSYDEFTTTQTPQEFINSAGQSFSPNMKTLLASFGLVPSDSNNEIVHPSDTSVPETAKRTSVQAEIDPSSYSVFKPIPERKEKQEMSGDMSEFLASYGLVDNDKKVEAPISRQRSKKLRDRSTTLSPFDAGIPTVHPENMSGAMKKVLHSLGLAPHYEPKDMIDEPVDVSADTPVSSARSANSAFIFNPTEQVELNNTEEVEQLKKLLKTFKFLSNTTTTIDEIEKQLRNASRFAAGKNLSSLLASRDQHLTLDQIPGAPDPLSLEELLYAINETRNEIHKRQKENKTTSSSTTTTTTTEKALKESSSNSEDDDLSEDSSTSNSQSDSSANSSSNEESVSIADLESSFGGSTDTVVDESLPPPKPNGFYFMLDWNSFLNVGEDDKAVNLRIAPKLGNSRNFLPVTVP